VLQWMAERVSIDAPCSGVKMLWSALYVAFSGALFFRLSAFGTWLSYVFASFLVFLGNVLRSTILFYTESGLVIAPSWIHQAVGAALLVIVCGLVLIVTKEVSFRWQLA